MTIFLVVGIDSTHDGGFRKNVIAYRERVTAETEAVRLNAEAEEKLSYNVKLYDLLAENDPFYPPPGEVWDGKKWEQMKMMRSEKRKAAATTYLRGRFPSLALLKEDPATKFELDTSNYIVEELELK